MASGFLGFLGKKKKSEAASAPASPVPTVRGPGSTPPPAAPVPPSEVPTGRLPTAPRPPGSSPLFERARKRVTQRLSLAGLNSTAPGSGKIKIPAASAAPVQDAPPAPAAPVEAVVEVPASELLPHIPEAVLLASATELAASPQAQSPFRLPLGTMLTMLPSGKIEVTVGDLATWAPEGIMHPPEVLGEWATQTASLPLPQIVMRISPEMMAVRRDQKQIDAIVLSMDDPFSPEALKAKAEAARAAAEAAASQAAAVPPPEPVPAAPLPPESEPEPESQAALPEPALEVPALPPEPEPVAPDFAPEMAATTYIPDPPALLAGEGKTEAQPDEAQPLSAEPESASSAPAPDFSFTQSPEYLEMLAKLNQEEEPPTQEADGAQDVSEPAASAQEVEVPQPQDAPEPPAPTAFAKPSFEFASTPTAAPVEPDQPDDTAPEPMRSPLAAAEEATPPALSSAFSKALSEIGRKSDTAAPRSEAPALAPVSSDLTPKAEDIRELLKLGPGVPVEIKDVVHHIGLWPGVDSCIICGLDGLPIASFAPPGRTPPQVAAVAPKLLKTVATLFTDLGRREPEELAVPSGDETLHFFRHHNMILILVSGEASIPPVYRRTIHNVLALLSTATRKS
jgi:predicted regulator of Ras-like GTPase activity (Roadblock/LC7/MglB family)